MKRLEIRQTMKILHISNDFCLTKVHSMLYQEPDRMGVEQTVFNPVRDAALMGRNSFEGEHTTIIYAHVVKPWHKYVMTEWATKKSILSSSAGAR